MWIYSRFGFFSVVIDPSVPEPKAGPWFNVSIRARVKTDLLKLLEQPTMLRSAQPEIAELPGRDYPYRIYASREELSEVMLLLSTTLDYSNFKNMVDHEPGMGPERHDLYSHVWSVMHDAERKLADMAQKAKETSQLPLVQRRMWSKSPKKRF